MRQVFKHIKYRGTFRRRQPLLIKEKLPAENQHVAILPHIGGNYAVQIIFMCFDNIIGEIQ